MFLGGFGDAVSVLNAFMLKKTFCCAVGRCGVLGNVNNKFDKV